MGAGVGASCPLHSLWAKVAPLSQTKKSNKEQVQPVSMAHIKSAVHNMANENTGNLTWAVKLENGAGYFEAKL